MVVIDQLARHWWVIALRGLVAVLFGILAFAWPGMTLALLVLFFGAYALADGILGIWAALRGEAEHRGAMLVEGAIGVAAGIGAFGWPGLTALVLLYIIAAWAILTGVLEIAIAVRLRQVIDNEWALIVGGALSLLFGVILIASPGTGALAVVWVIATYAIVFGVVLLALSWRLRGLSQRVASVRASGRPVSP